MSKVKNYRFFFDKNRLNISLFLIILAGVILFFKSNLGAKTNFLFRNSLPQELVIIQGNTFGAISSSDLEPKISRKIKVLITGYSSTPWETDDEPHITAAGTSVREGIIANNSLPLGTKLRIPELFGEKIFVVEDRMSWKKGNYHFDVWFPSYQEALNFGVKRTYIEVL